MELWIAHHRSVATRFEEYAEWVLRPQLPERPTRPRSSYFICGTPRSGSWLLAGLLASTGVAGRPHEWFWRDTEEANRRAWGILSFSDYVAHVHDAGTTSNGTSRVHASFGFGARASPPRPCRGRRRSRPATGTTGTRANRTALLRTTASRSTRSPVRLRQETPLGGSGLPRTRSSPS